MRASESRYIVRRVPDLNKRLTTHVYPFVKSRERELLINDRNRQALGMLKLSADQIETRIAQEKGRRLDQKAAGGITCHELSWTPQHNRKNIFSKLNRCRIFFGPIHIRNSSKSLLIDAE